MLEPYIRLNKDKRKKAYEEKNKFKETFFKCMNDAAFRKTMENVRKHRDVKSVTTDKKKK